MDISSLTSNVYYQNENIVKNSVENSLNEELSKVNNLSAVYVDPDAIRDLSLKSAHTSEILLKKIKDINENRPLKNLNFEKESNNFDKSNIESVNGDLKNSQANYISAKRVSELLN